MGQLTFQATLGGQVNLVGPNTASTFNINVPAIAGNMVTTGDTGTVTAAMLASTTGTGAVVLATSPALVTPALGTPTALVGTNITGTATAFTASNVTTNANLTGAVTSVGNATSLGSFTSAQLSGALTDETGTGANVFATSPTLATPVINGFTGDTSVINIGSGQVYKDASGNVGIGTSSPVNKVTVNGGVSLLPYYETYLANSYYSGGWKYAGNGHAWGIGNNFGGPANGTTIAIAAVNAGGAGAALTWTPVFNIDSSGNLLVGTTTAVQKLTVSGSIHSTGTVRTGGYTVATLPAGTAGMQAYVTDALTPGFLTVVVGGGAVVSPVFYNGSNWVAG